MFKTVALSALSLGRRSIGARLMSHGPVESAEAFDERYVKFFSKADIDGWEVRKGINDLAGMDLVPEPKIVDAALRACRKVNDYALAIRLLETVRFKSLSHADIYPYVMQEIKPTLDELGIDTLETLGYDKPELAVTSVYSIH